MTPPTPLTILHIAAPGAEGGLEAVVLDLTTGLRRRGNRVILAAVQDAGAGETPYLRRVSGAGVEVRRIEVPPRGYLLEWRLLRDTIASLQPDVVHTHGYRADILGGFVARRTGTPWVSTTHGFTGGDRKNRLYEWFQVSALRRTSAVIAVSDGIRRRLIAGGVTAGRVHLLPNAWAPKPLLARDEARRRLGLGDGPPVIGWVGRLSAEKGADIFLRALALLRAIPWRASIIGDGRERSALEALARSLGIADRVSWHGLVPEAASLYSAFDSWVLSSRTEGTPIALFEAMAARVPAIVTTVGGVPAVVSQAEARLVPPEHPDELAAAIAEVLSDSGAAAIRAEAAHRRLVEHYAPPAWIEAHEALYRSLQITGTARA